MSLYSYVINGKKILDIVAFFTSLVMMNVYHVNQF